MELKGTGNVKLTGSVSIGIRTILSNRHIQCALICAKKSNEIESQYSEGSKWEENAPLYQEDQAYSWGAIISSVAYLESLINEFFNDCNYNAEEIKSIGEEEIKLLNKHYEKDFKCRRKGPKHLKIFCKYLTAYSIINGKGIYKKSDLCQNFIDLIQLRNALTHYHSEFQFEMGDPYGLNQLQGRFKENIFMNNVGNSFFPFKCLGAGCAEWAVNISIDFTEFFYSEIGLKSKMAEVKKIQLGMS
ncbi:hypothetical protein [Methanoregula sp.]|uniref:hypothetical protein n=1 Tax=Methanoregula sp. TaxID=2052170 RepID=UPI002B7E8754|nr:hypothetical protein [Methanoregula sp.]HVP97289.1 hypothetical protein [Methanoregula sp.]